MAEKRGQFQYNDDGSVAQLVAGEVETRSNEIAPVEIQARYSQTIQTHTNAVVAPTNGVSDSVWFDTEGFDKIAISLKNDASTNSVVELHWSHDNSNRTGLEAVMAASTLSERVAITDTKARYVKVRITNQDAAAHTMNAWIYLKA